jgi:hypothetical protein
MPARAFAVLLSLLAVVPVAAVEPENVDNWSFPVVEGKRIVIDVGNLNLRMRSADIDEIRVLPELRISGVGEQRAERWVEENTPVVEDRTEELRITAATGRTPALGRLTARARLGVLAPSTVIPDLTTSGGPISLRGDFPLARPLRLRTSSSDMVFEGAAAALDIRTAGGNAEVTVFRPLERLFARTSSGNISLRGGAQLAEVDTASGSVSLGNLSGPVVVETSTGRITLSWDHLDAGDLVRVRSTSGRVELVLPAGVEPGGTLTTTTGTIRCDLPGEWNERGDTLRLSGDGPELAVETASSEIVIALGEGWSD